MRRPRLLLVPAALFVALAAAAVPSAAPADTAASGDCSRALADAVAMANTLNVAGVNKDAYLSDVVRGC